LDPFKDLEVTTLLSKLEELTKELKKYGKVNTQALSKYENFVDVKDQLRDRKDDIDNSETSMQNLMEHLKDKKIMQLLIYFIL